MSHTKVFFEKSFNKYQSFIGIDTFFDKIIMYFYILHFQYFSEVAIIVMYDMHYISVPDNITL